MKLLSKSKLLNGYRCLKAIHQVVHNPERIPPVSPAQQQVFDQGTAVGVKAREYYPGGTLVDSKPWEFVDSLRKTRELMAAGCQHIYEAAFEYKGCYARADILRYNPHTQRWSLIEVKSTTKIKDEHIDDVGLQAWIIVNSGVPLERISIAYLNRDCRYPDLTDLFREEDVTDRLRENYTGVAPRLNAIFSTLRTPATPEVDIGPHCTLHGRDCDFKARCWAARGVPELSVFDLPGLREKAWDYYRRGQVALGDLDLAELDDLAKRIVQAHREGRRCIEGAAVAKALSEWRYPLYYLDFETVNPAIPAYHGTGPYQQVPFQFSVHVQRAPEAPLEHFEYLHDGEGDPRAALVPALLRACHAAGDGSIVSYYANFEKSRIEELAEYAPTAATALLTLNARLVDPLPLIRAHIYDPGFAASFSLKAVAPALLGERFSYDGLQVADGTAAQRAYVEMCKAPSPERRAQLRQAMLDYCRQDTLAMVELVGWLKALPAD